MKDTLCLGVEINPKPFPLIGIILAFSGRELRMVRLPKSQIDGFRGETTSETRAIVVTVEVPLKG